MQNHDTAECFSLSISEVAKVFGISSKETKVSYPAGLFSGHFTESLFTFSASHSKIKTIGGRPVFSHGVIDSLGTVGTLKKILATKWLTGKELIWMSLKTLKLPRTN